MSHPQITTLFFLCGCVIDWYAESKRARTNTDVHKIVLGDRKLKLREIADTLKIQSAVWSCSNEVKRTFSHACTEMDTFLD